MIRSIQRFWPLLAAILAVAYLAGMLFTGALPGRGNLIRSKTEGVLSLDPAAITQVTVISGEAAEVFVRQGGDWITRKDGAAIEAGRAKTLNRAVKFMYAAAPVRKFNVDDMSHDGLTKFGLDHPSVTVSLESASGVVLAAEFGNKDNDNLLRYMRLRGGEGIYLMSGFVGAEWDAVARAIKH